MLERLVGKAEETGAEMVICDYYVNTINRQYRKYQDPHSTTGEGALRALFQRLHGSLWNKLILSACYRIYGIRFPEGLNYCEDFLTCVALLQKIQHVAYLPEAFYHYDQYSNPQPATRNEDSKRIDTTRTEVVRRCREMVPDRQKGWQYYIFEVNSASAILEKGGMDSEEFRKFFSDIPLTTLCHPQRHRFVPILLTVLAIHTPMSRLLASCIFEGYMAMKLHVKRLIGRQGR